MKARLINIVAAIAFCLYLTAVALLCFMHGEDLPTLTGTWFGLPADKVAHFSMFFPFIPLAFFTFNSKKAKLGNSMCLLIILMLIGGATAYATEIIQEKLSYRSYEAEDFFLDCIGLAAGYIIITTWLIFKHSRKKH